MRYEDSQNQRLNGLAVSYCRERSSEWLLLGHYPYRANDHSD
jgi:hypothetical protein